MSNGNRTSATASHVEQIASRAVTLYSRPTVAMELVRLAEEPRIEARRLKECIAQDPALACKVLRVVNSSLYGLNRPVADLNQAISLLGIKPLKLLTLGFSLPDALFAEMAARELRWYWTNTLTRAVSARLLAEQFWGRAPHDAGSGDEAFLVGLLQDIGILVLLRELGQPYARFLAGVIEEKCDLAALETATLGFNHAQLSAALLARWQLPPRLVDAIAAPKWTARLARLESPEADLPQILHLAELLVRLVSQRRLDVLGELLEASRVYRGITKPQLAALVKGLQPQVDQLAEVLSLELAEKREYVQVLVDAHQQMAALGEQVVIGEASSPTAEDAAHVELLSHTEELSAAVQHVLQRQPSRIEHGISSIRDEESPASGHFGTFPDSMTLARKLAAAARRCRDRRQELSLLVVEPNVYDIHADPRGELASRQVRRALGSACAGLDETNVGLVSLTDQRTAAVISDCERRAALAVAQHAIEELGKIAVVSTRSGGDLTTTLSIGLATASVVPKNFDPLRMIESAARCLWAARAGGVSAVKSIEV